MYTQCPRCLTIYEVDGDALQASLGIVCCGHCAERFDALRTLSDSLPTGPARDLPSRDGGESVPVLREAVAASAASANPRGGEAWHTPAGTRTLIADAAGLPRGSLAAEPEWQALDALANAAADVAAASRVEPPSARADAGAATATPLGAAASEPLTSAWTLDNAEYAVDAPTPTAPRTPDRDPESSVDSDDESAVAMPPGTAGSAPLSDAWGLDLAEPATTVVPALLAASNETGPQTSPPREAAADGAADEPDRDAMPTPEEAPAASPVGADGRALVAYVPDPTPAAQPFAPALDAPVDVAADAAPIEDAPVYVPLRRRRVRGRDVLWGVGCGALALMLAAQFAWGARASLVRDPATQAWALRACARLDCRLPPIRDTARLELVSRDVRPDPAHAGALTITATVRNNARFRQPWPVVAVTLADLDGRAVAMRRFRPSEYVPDPTRRASGLAAGATAALVFEVADPGRNAVSFRFGFE